MQLRAEQMAQLSQSNNLLRQSGEERQRQRVGPPYLVIQSEHPSDALNIGAILVEDLGVALYERGVYRLRLPCHQDLEVNLITLAHNEIVASIRFWSIEGLMRARLLGLSAVRC
tara:strand:- start:112 stop:453 length:342 start_codon:yes stop_codon:yes gene_type:complete